MFHIYQLVKDSFIKDWLILFINYELIIHIYLLYFHNVY